MLVTAMSGMGMTLSGGRPAALGRPACETARPPVRVAAGAWAAPGHHSAPGARAREAGPRGAVAGPGRRAPRTRVAPDRSRVGPEPSTVHAGEGPGARTAPEAGQRLSLPFEAAAARPASRRATGMRNGEQET
ncbi:hypothetical protein Sdia_19450 [Streptomyces diastaticus subsp. diastaticus]|uniref:Uncharacterized protein n=1 Tax=Streptomyces diastaticus subsp. diastaticus TaxID=68040 RepID=A0ABQ1CLW0_STRDI|nr:hypothetical protein Srut_24380 [Streptomyces rutgersensis]GFH71177.1 hypothetical protein Sdia_19450 [Streptomyces diastaticus subsp. diastaticus]GGU32207.1 hypothetical protein GCM10015534_38640 [Streptomyces diastaticus subsp. diastaticus]